MQNPRPSSPLSKAIPTSLLSSSHSLDKHTLSPMKPNLIEIPSSMIPYKDQSPVIGDNTPQSMVCNVIILCTNIFRQILG